MSSWNEAAKLSEARTLVRKFIRESLNEATMGQCVVSVAGDTGSKVLDTDFVGPFKNETEADAWVQKNGGDHVCNVLVLGSPDDPITEVGGMGSGNSDAEGDVPEQESEVEGTY